MTHVLIIIGIIAAVMAFYCAITTIIHETGHYAMSRKIGLHPDSVKIGVGKKVIYHRGVLTITALPFSGMVHHTDAEWHATSQRKQNLIALAGPMANLIIGLITIYWMPVFGLLNIMTFCGNLIPLKTSKGYTDGGYLFRPVGLAVRLPMGILLAAATIVLFVQVALTMVGR